MVGEHSETQMLMTVIEGRVCRRDQRSQHGIIEDEDNNSHSEARVKTRNDSYWEGYLVCKDVDRLVNNNENVLGC